MMSDSDGGCLPVLLIGLGIWAVFGEPSNMLADIFWDDDATPWEEVYGYYYPDRSDLQRFKKDGPFNNIDECRDWVSSQARRHNDQKIIRGDYECGIGLKEGYGGLDVYRLTIR